MRITTELEHLGMINEEPHSPRLENLEDLLQTSTINDASPSRKRHILRDSVFQMNLLEADAVTFQ